MLLASVLSNAVTRLCAAAGVIARRPSVQTARVWSPVRCQLKDAAREQAQLVHQGLVAEHAPYLSRPPVGVIGRHEARGATGYLAEHRDIAADDRCAGRHRLHHRKVRARLRQQGYTSDPVLLVFSLISILLDDRLTSVYRPNGRLRHNGQGAVRRALRCVVSRVGFCVSQTSSE